MIYSESLNKLTAEKGMVLTNGSVFLREVCLSKNSNPSNWYEITEEEYQKILQEQEMINIDV